MKGNENLFTKFAANADLELCGIPGTTVVEIAGRERILIENHLGIIEYGNCIIRIKVKNGCICVKGGDLVLSRMTQNQLIINGCIENVALLGGG